MNWQPLIDAAWAAHSNAHAPYSKFHVGAAVLTADGRVFGGCNVEISSYSHTCCAERVAVFKAVSEGATDLVAVAVVTNTSPPAPPCGACRQVLHDFGPGMVVRLANADGETKDLALADLLPHAFGPDQLLS